MNFVESLDVQFWNGLNLSNLNVDEAYLNLTSSLKNCTLQLYSLYEDCHRCPFSYVTSLNESSKVITVSTKHNSIWRIFNGTKRLYLPEGETKFLVCEFNASFQEFGVYDLITDDNECNLKVSKSPVNVYLPLLVVMFGLFLGFLMCKGFGKYLKCCFRSQKNDTVIDESGSSCSNKTKSSRISSIDTFRGFALCLMIFVNDGGGQYWFFSHCTWDGLYVTDLLYPWFLWVMGICIALSQKTLGKQTTSFLTLVKNISQRASILFLLGLALSTLGFGPVDVSNIRIPGVLQRIAVCYFVVSLISVLVWKIQVKLFSSFNYLIVLLPQWLIHFSILYGHYYLTFQLPVPGCPTGYLGAAGIQDNGKYENCTGGSAGYLDRLILGEEHLLQWEDFALRKVYHTKVAFDPENILGCLTSIFETFLGMQAGFILCQSSKRVNKVRQLLIWSFILCPAGLILHYYQVIPLNKNLWSISFMLTTSGLAFLVFGIFYYIIDCVGIWSGSPFIYPGMNSVLVYVGHEVCFQLFPWHWKVGQMNTHFLNLLENSWGVILWMLITYIMFKKRVFINV